MLMRTLAQETASDAIRISSVSPGAIRTPINASAWNTKGAPQQLLRVIPYGRIGEPEDVASAVAWLVSDEAHYVTGTTLSVDGGMTLYPAFKGPWLTCPIPVAGRALGEHGIVGNLNTVALVATDGTIDFMCWPHLDSPSIFAALLDPERGGEFELAPLLEGARPTQMYVPDTNVLVTSWRALQGSAELTDLMPHPRLDDEVHCTLIRRIRVTRGTVRFHLKCRPRLDYARALPEARAAASGVVFGSEGAPMVWLTGSVPIAAGENQATATFELEQGEEAFFGFRTNHARRPTPPASHG